VVTRIGKYTVYLDVRLSLVSTVTTDITAAQGLIDGILCGITLTGREASADRAHKRRSQSSRQFVKNDSEG